MSDEWLPKHDFAVHCMFKGVEDAVPYEIQKALYLDYVKTVPLPPSKKSPVWASSEITGLFGGKNCIAEHACHFMEARTNNQLWNFFHDRTDTPYFPDDGHTGSVLKAAMAHYRDIKRSAQPANVNTYDGQTEKPFIFPKKWVLPDGISAQQVFRTAVLLVGEAAHLVPEPLQSRLKDEHITALRQGFRSYALTPAILTSEGFRMAKDLKGAAGHLTGYIKTTGKDYFLGLADMCEKIASRALKKFESIESLKHPAPPEARRTATSPPHPQVY